MLLDTVDLLRSREPQIYVCHIIILRSYYSVVLARVLQ